MKCCLAECREPGAVRLQGTGYPEVNGKVDDTFIFCVTHAPIYEQRGYRRVRQASEALHK